MAVDQKPHGFPQQEHNHTICVDEALGAAAQLCARRGVKLTPLRRRVLELVWISHRPIGAYDILPLLGGDRRSAAPPTVYRALDFLLEQGLVHRIASLNAYIGCPAPGHAQIQEILICTKCGRAAESGDGGVVQAIRRSAGALGFAVERPTIEVLGQCRDCVSGNA